MGDRSPKHPPYYRPADSVTPGVVRTNSDDPNSDPVVYLKSEVDTLIVPSTLLDQIGNVQGDLLYRDAAAWAALAPGGANRILKAQGAAANPIWDTLSNLLDTLGSSWGNILFRGTAGWVVLAPGTSGWFLKTLGAGADPAWAAVAGGSPGGGSRAIQYNQGGGVFGGSSKVFIDSTNDSLNLNAPAASPAAPASGSLVYTRQQGGRDYLVVRGANDFELQMQKFMGGGKVCYAKPRVGTTTLDGFGFSNTTSGTVSAGAYSQSSMRTMTHRISIASAAAAGSSAAWLQNALGWSMGTNSNLPGGFLCVIRFAFNTMPAGARFFAGMQTSTAILGNVDPSTVNNLIGVSKDAGDTNAQCISRGTTAATKVNSGIALATTRPYEVRILVESNGQGTKAYISLQDGNHDTTAGSGSLFDTVISTNIPAGAIDLAPQLWFNNGATASAATVEFISCYIEGLD